MAKQKESQQERLEKQLLKILDPDEKRLMQLITIESRKNKLVFRMPLDIISLESVWNKIHAAGLELAIECMKAQSMYATVGELDDVLGDVQWIWKDWLPRGFISMIVGDPGIGKSMLVLHLMKMITGALNFPTIDNKEKAANVLWIDTEASQQLLRIRVKKMGVDENRIYIPVIDGDILGQVDVMNEEHRNVILDYVDNIKPAVIVLDSLGGSHTRGENKFEDIAPIMKFFALVARDKNIGVLMTHHLNKGMQTESPEVSLYRIRGSTAIPQFARCIMAMEKIKDNEVRLRVIKNNLARITTPLSIIPTFDIEGDITEIQYKAYTPPPKKQTKQEVCASWVITQLKSNTDEKGYRLKDLIEAADAEGFSRGNLHTAKIFLADRVRVGGTGKEAYWFYNNGTEDNDVKSISKLVKTKRKA